MSELSVRIKQITKTIVLIAAAQSVNAWALVGAVNDSYDGAEIQSPSNEVMNGGSTYLFEWNARPAPGKTAITLFSLYDQSSPWSEITFELFGGGANGSTDMFQTQYISEGGKQHLKYHSSPNVFDGNHHTFGISYRPSNGGTSAQIKWYIDGSLIRTVTGGDANDLDNTMRVHAGVWKVHNSGWGSLGTTGLADRTTASVKKITRSVRINNSWSLEKDWRFTSNSSLSAWTLSDWTFSSFDGRYTPANAKIVSGSLHLVLSRQGYSNSACTITNGIHYALQNTKSGKYMDVKNFGTSNGSLLQQFGSDAVWSNRKFKAVSVGSGNYAFQNTGAGRYLDVKGNSVSNKAQLQLWSTNSNSANRQFDLVNGQNGGCELRPRQTITAGQTKCIGVTGGSTSNGAGIIQYSCNTSADQEWNFIPR